MLFKLLSSLSPIQQIVKQAMCLLGSVSLYCIQYAKALCTRFGENTVSDASVITNTQLTPVLLHYCRVTAPGTVCIVIVRM